ncbi:LysR family transcriptional regulator [Sciscionella sediminilitoris]|uniref:LysR family transcriptional regulator n=1 Tax=Sciscionella sediminilitoris TaxID=1445613 RepID=UPI0004DF0321|nr:LysR family transcriptional regulator [Sciscionella sp. SE31]
MLDITPRQLEAFVWIVRLGTFRAAAERLGLSQPAISLRIRQLETAAGTALFHRRGTAVGLTADGTLLLHYAERELALLEELGQRLRAGDPWQGTLRLGSSDLFAMTCLPRVLERLERSHPEVNVRLTASSSVALARMLDRGELDLAFMSNAEPSEHVRVEELGNTALTIVSNGNRGLPERIAPEDLAGQRILINPPPSAIHGIVARWFGEADIPLPNFSTCNSLPVTSGLVAAGGGIGFLPHWLVRADLEAGILTAHRPRTPLRDLRLSLAHSRTTPQVIVDFLRSAGRRALRDQ